MMNNLKKYNNRVAESSKLRMEKHEMDVKNADIAKYRGKLISEASESTWQLYLNALVAGDTETILIQSRQMDSMHPAKTKAVIKVKTVVKPTTPIVLKPHKSRKEKLVFVPEPIAEPTHIRAVSLDSVAL